MPESKLERVSGVEPSRVVTRPRRSVVDDPQLRAHLKQQLRRQLKAVRKALPAEARARRSDAITERLLALEEWVNASFVAAFVSIRGEADLSALVDQALARDGRVAFPRVDTEANDIFLHEVKDPRALVRGGAFDIPEPSPDAPLAPLAAIDLVLVPALGLDPMGRRIGWGRGYYDRLLPQLPRAVRVAVAYDFQLLAEIPDQPHDARVDFIVTDTRTIEVATGREG